MVKVTSDDIKALNEFLENRNVNYVLTGTAALYYHEALPDGEMAHDIDIIVLTTPDTRPALQSMFKELEALSCCQNDNYADRNCFTFKVGANNIKVNALKGTPGEVPFRLMNIDGAAIKVHGVKSILAAKFGLGREKDHIFFAKIVKQLSCMFRYV